MSMYPTKVLSGSSHPCPIDSVSRIVTAIGQGMRLVIPQNGEQPYLIDGILYGDPKHVRSSIPVPASIAADAIVKAPLVELKPDGEFHRGKMIRGGYKEFYSGPPAQIYCLVQ